MMSLEKTLFEQECDIIREERVTYKIARPMDVNKFFDKLSAIFLCLGFIALALIPFTEITLLQATCLFIIHYTIAPTEVDLTENIIKGVAEDLGYIRANITVIRKNSEQLKD